MKNRQQPLEKPSAKNAQIKQENQRNTLGERQEAACLSSFSYLQSGQQTLRADAEYDSLQEDLWRNMHPHQALERVLETNEQQRFRAFKKKQLRSPVNTNITARNAMIQALYFQASLGLVLNTPRARNTWDTPGERFQNDLRREDAAFRNREDASAPQTRSRSDTLKSACSCDHQMNAQSNRESRTRVNPGLSVSASHGASSMQTSDAEAAIAVAAPAVLAIREGIPLLRQGVELTGRAITRPRGMLKAVGVAAAGLFIGGMVVGGTALFGNRRKDEDHQSEADDTLKASALVDQPVPSSQDEFDTSLSPPETTASTQAVPRTTADEEGQMYGDAAASPTTALSYDMLSRTDQILLREQIKREYQERALKTIDITDGVWDLSLNASLRLPSTSDGSWIQIVVDAERTSRVLADLTAWIFIHRPVTPPQDILERASTTQDPWLPLDSEHLARTADYLAQQRADKARNNKILAWYQTLQQPTLSDQAWRQTFLRLRHTKAGKGWRVIAAEAQQEDREMAFHEQIQRMQEIERTSDPQLLLKLIDEVKPAYSNFFPRDIDKGFMSEADLDWKMTEDALLLAEVPAYRHISHTEWTAAIDSYRNNEVAPDDVVQIAEKAISLRAPRYEALATLYVRQYPYRGSAPGGVQQYFLDVLQELCRIDNSGYLAINEEALAREARNFQLWHQGGTHVRNLTVLLDNALLVEKNLNSVTETDVLEVTLESVAPATEADNHPAVHSMEYEFLAARYVRQYPYRGRDSDEVQRYFLDVLQAISTNANPDYHSITEAAWNQQVSNVRTRHVKGNPTPEVIGFLNDALSITEENNDGVTKTKIDTSLRIRSWAEYSTVDVLDIVAKALKDPFGEATTPVMQLLDAKPSTTASARKLGTCFSQLANLLISAAFPKTSVAITLLADLAEILKEYLGTGTISGEALSSLTEDTANLWMIIRPELPEDAESHTELARIKADLDSNLGTFGNRKIEPAPAETVQSTVSKTLTEKKITPSDTWRSNISFQDITADAQGIYHINNDRYILVDGHAYKISFDAHINSWTLMRGDGMHQKLYTAHVDSSGGWTIDIVGLRGGGGDGIPVQTDRHGRTFHESIRPVSRLEQELVVLRRTLGYGEKIRIYDAKHKQFRASNDFTFLDLHSENAAGMAKLAEYAYTESDLATTLDRYEKDYLYLSTLIKMMPSETLAEQGLEEMQHNMQRGHEMSTMLKQRLALLQTRRESSGVADASYEAEDDFFVTEHFYSVLGKQDKATDSLTSEQETSPSRAKSILNVESRQRGDETSIKVVGMLGDPYTQFSDAQFREIQLKVAELQRTLAQSGPSTESLKMNLFLKNINTEKFQTFLHDFPLEGGQQHRLKNLSHYMTEKAIISLLPSVEGHLTLTTTPINPRTAQVSMQNGFSANLAAFKHDPQNNLYQAFGKDYARIQNKIYEVEKNPQTGNYEACTPRSPFRRHRPVRREPDGQWNFGRTGSRDNSPQPGPSHRHTRSVPQNIASMENIPRSLINPRPLPDTLYRSDLRSPDEIKSAGGIKTPISAMHGYDEEALQVETNRRNSLMNGPIYANSRMRQGRLRHQFIALGKRIDGDIKSMPEGAEKSSSFTSAHEEALRIGTELEQLKNMPMLQWTPYHLHMERVIRKLALTVSGPASQHIEKSSFSGVSEVKNSPFVGASVSVEQARLRNKYLLRGEGYIYEIAPTPNFIDMQSATAPRTLHPSEYEWSAYQVIPWQQIKGWYIKTGQFVANPDYREAN